MKNVIDVKKKLHPSVLCIRIIGLCRKNIYVENSLSYQLLTFNPHNKIAFGLHSKQKYY